MQVTRGNGHNLEGDSGMLLPNLQCGRGKTRERSRRWAVPCLLCAFCFFLAHCGEARKRTLVEVNLWSDPAWLVLYFL